MRLLWSGLLLLSSVASAAAPPQPRKASVKTRSEQKRWSYGEVKDVPVSVAQTSKTLESWAHAGEDQIQLSKIGKVKQFPLYRVDLPATGIGKARPMRILVSGGVHGNEPAGVETAMRFIDFARKNPDLRSKFDITVLP